MYCTIFLYSPLCLARTEKNCSTFGSVIKKLLIILHSFTLEPYKSIVYDVRPSQDILFLINFLYFIFVLIIIETREYC